MRTALILAIALLASEFPVTAQDQTQAVSIASSSLPSTPFPAPPSPPVQPASRAILLPPSLLRISGDFHRPDSTHIFAGIQTDSIASLDGIVGRNDTDFAAERFFPMIAPAQGKIELSGFYGLRSMENMLLGLPGAGVLPAWSVAHQSHPAILTPVMDTSYGMTLKFHFHHDEDGSLHAAGFHCLGKLVGKGHGCRILYY